MQLGLIYKLTSASTDIVYIGSTTLSINDRFIRHKASLRRFQNNNGDYCSAFELMQLPDVKIELIENVDFNDRDFLRERENYHILRNDCVNIKNAKFDYDTYYLLNKDRLKQYYQINSIQKKEYQRNRYNRIKLLKNPENIENLFIRDF
jgi:hypothetical protein